MSSTIKDVAKEAGVSTASVSRVVNSFPSVSPEVREKVERAMKKLRFVPDRKAKSLATGKTGSVVFLTSYETLFEDPHKFAILSGIEHSLARYKYRVYFLQVERGDLAPLRKMASQKEMDGLVVHGIEITASLLDIVHEFAIPTLLIGEPKEKCSLSWIDNNNEVCGEVAANCLLSHGRTHFLFVGGEEADNISLSRLHGVKRALAKKGIELEERRILSLEPVAIQAEKAVRTALSSFEIDAVVAANNFLALGALRALQDAKKKVPSEVSIITFDDYPLALYTKPKLSSVSIDVHSLGLSAGRAIVEQMRHPEQVSETYIAFPRLNERSSTRYDK